MLLIKLGMVSFSNPFATKRFTNICLNLLIEFIFTNLLGSVAQTKSHSNFRISLVFSYVEELVQQKNSGSWTGKKLYNNQW